MKQNSKQLFILLPLLLTISSLQPQPVFTIDFLFNGFNSSDLLLYGNAHVESRLLTLTNNTYFAIGRALYPKKVATKSPNSSYVLPPFLLPSSSPWLLTRASFRAMESSSSSRPPPEFKAPARRSIWVSSTEPTMATPETTSSALSSMSFENQEFHDIGGNHVGVDVNSLTSTTAHTAGYWRRSGEFEELKLNNGNNYQAWIDYSGGVVNVSMAVAGTGRPEKPLLNVRVNLTGVFEDEMLVGFAGATGRLVEGQRILGWSYSNSKFSAGEGLITTGLPSFVLPKKQVCRFKAVLAGVLVGSCSAVCVIVLLLFWMKKNDKRRIQLRRDEKEEWELDYWPHRIEYQVINAATKGFSEENVIGIGGDGKVYKGVLLGGAEVAVKHISLQHDRCTEVLTEICSLGRLKHRNLMGLRGWCRKDRTSFLLVYDYMENGSLDKRVFQCNESYMLGFKERYNILTDVAVGVLYLHEGWDSKVLHRDIKASNVLLDKDMNGKLGDFGLACIHKHEQVATTTNVVGTVGYLAPEVIQTGRVSTRSDVFGFGMLVLEVMCGRRPLEEGGPALLEWVWQLKMQGELLKALDARLRVVGGFGEEEVDMVLHLGLSCAYPNPGARPSMRQVVQLLEGKNVSGEATGGNLDADLLLQMVKSQDWWSSYNQGPGSGSQHPTLEDIRLSNPSLVSSSWNSNKMVEGSESLRDESCTQNSGKMSKKGHQADLLVRVWRSLLRKQTHLVLD